MQPSVAYLLLIVATLVLLGALGGYAWRHRRSPGGARFLGFVAAAGAWALLVGAMAIAEPATARVLLSVKYLAIGIAGTTTFLFVAQRTGHTTRLTRAQLAAFFLVPVLGHLASFSDRAGMVREVAFGRAYGLTHIASITFGPVYWLFTLYLYALTLAGIALLFRTSREGGPLQRVQALPMLVGITAPLLANILLITGIAPRAFDPMPLGLAIAALCLWWAAFRGRMLDLVPMARQVLVDALPDGILIVDADQRIVDMNDRFARLVTATPADLVGLTVAECAFPVQAMRQAVLDALGAATGREAKAPRPVVQIGDSVFDLRIIAVEGHASRAAAHIVVLQDVTERQRWEDEQARLITELRDALGQVKTLTGLLPICADCKRICDGAGEWHRLEVYIRDRTQADFSHGMCPSCLERWYPTLVDSTEPARS